MKYKSTIAFPNFVLVWSQRLFGLFVIAKAAEHYNTNPTGLSILIAIALVILIRSRTDQLSLDNDVILFKKRYFFDLFSLTDTIDRKVVHHIQVEGNRNVTHALINSIMPFSPRVHNLIILELKDGNERCLETTLYREQLSNFKNAFDECKTELV